MKASDKAKFEIGDRVKVLACSLVDGVVGMAGVIDGYHNRSDLLFVNLGSDFNGHFGGSSVVNSEGKRIAVDHNNGRWFLPEDLELDKESKVLEILKNYELYKQERSRKQGFRPSTKTR